MGARGLWGGKREGEGEGERRGGARGGHFECIIFTRVTIIMEKDVVTVKTVAPPTSAAEETLDM